MRCLKRVNELQLKENELRATFTDDSIPVLEAKRQVDEAKAILKKTEETRQVTKGINDTRQRIELNLLTEESVLASLKAKDEALKAQLAQAQEELNTINDVEQRMKQLELDNTIQQASYQKYSESFEQSLIDQALDLVKISNISIVQPATYPIKHARPRVLLNLMLGILLGTFWWVRVGIYQRKSGSFFWQAGGHRENFGNSRLGSNRLFISGRSISSRKGSHGFAYEI